jgi:hypothetical protein
LDVSGYCFCNLGKELDKIGNPKIRRSPDMPELGGRTCPRNLSGIQLRGRICPARDLATEEEVRPGHVQAGGRTCLKNLFGIWSENQICLTFLGILVGR